MSRPEALDPLLVRARATARRHREVDDLVTAALRPLQLSTARCLMLEAVDRQAPDGTSIAGLAAFLGVHRTSAAELLDQLVRSGLVVRDVDGTDARKSLSRLTDSGRQRLTLARRILAEQAVVSGGPTPRR